MISRIITLFKGSLLIFFQAFRVQEINVIRAVKIRPKSIILDNDIECHMSLNLQKVVFVKAFYPAPFKYTFNYKEV